MEKFKFLTGDVNWKDYGGKWYRYDGCSCYTIIEFCNMQDCCDNISNSKYLVIVRNIDLSSLSYTGVSNASKTCGEPIKEVMKDQLLLLEVCDSYGLSDNIDHRYGNNYTALLKWAKSL